jgi:hypothetical protein
MCCLSRLLIHSSTNAHPRPQARAGQCRPPRSSAEVSCRRCAQAERDRALSDDSDGGQRRRNTPVLAHNCRKDLWRSEQLAAHRVRRGEDVVLLAAFFGVQPHRAQPLQRVRIAPARLVIAYARHHEAEPRPPTAVTLRAIGRRRGMTHRTSRSMVSVLPDADGQAGVDAAAGAAASGSGALLEDVARFQTTCETGTSSATAPPRDRLPAVSIRTRHKSAHARQTTCTSGACHLHSLGATEPSKRMLSSLRSARRLTRRAGCAGGGGLRSRRAKRRRSSPSGMIRNGDLAYPAAGGAPAERVRLATPISPATSASVSASSASFCCW